jgi:menaquinone-dependent protoporphyrinogen IX oxidase
MISSTGSQGQISAEQFQRINFSASISAHQFQRINFSASISAHQFQRNPQEFLSRVMREYISRIHP